MDIQELNKEQSVDKRTKITMNGKREGLRLWDTYSYEGGRVLELVAWSVFDISGSPTDRKRDAPHKMLDYFNSGVDNAVSINHEASLALLQELK